MVPKAWQGDTESVLFVCKIHRDYTLQMAEVRELNADLEKHSQFLELDQLAMKVAAPPSPTGLLLWRY
jgi:hypothetical protein